MMIIMYASCFKPSPGEPLWLALGSDIRLYRDFLPWMTTPVKQHFSHALTFIWVKLRKTLEGKT